jgi:hypothetical protein
MQDERGRPFLGRWFVPGARMSVRPSSTGCSLLLLEREALDG